MKELEKWQLGYIAGIIDGEGCIGLAHTKRYYAPHITVNMTHELTVKTLYYSTGLGTVCQRKAPLKKETYKVNWHWQVQTFAEIHCLLRLILPYLIVKRELAELMLQYCERRLLEMPYSQADDVVFGKMQGLNKDVGKGLTS